jgi:hypothetical protein
MKSLAYIAIVLAVFPLLGYGISQVRGPTEDSAGAVLDPGCEHDRALIQKLRLKGVIQ